MGFAMSKPHIHSSIECVEGSIPFTRSTYPPFSLNGLPLQCNSWNSDSHNGFKELYLKLDTQLSILIHNLM